MTESCGLYQEELKEILEARIRYADIISFNWIYDHYHVPKYQFIRYLRHISEDPSWVDRVMSDHQITDMKIRLKAGERPSQICSRRTWAITDFTYAQKKQRDRYPTFQLDDPAMIDRSHSINRGWWFLPADFPRNKWSIKCGNMTLRVYRPFVEVPFFRIVKLSEVSKAVGTKGGYRAFVTAIYGNKSSLYETVRGRVDTAVSRWRKTVASKE